VERRTIWTSRELLGWRAWPGLVAACIVERKTWNRQPGSYRVETTYLIGSMDSRKYVPEGSLRINRAHWGIENRLHYVKDVSLGEDACRVRTKSSPQILAGVRNAVVSLFRRDGGNNIAAALRHHAVKISKAFTLIGIAEN
jgi:hypothetical protein